MKKDGFFVLILAGIAGFFLYPATQEIYLKWNEVSPFGMAFVKFGVLASLGEALALRMRTGEWQRVLGWPKKAVVWGFLGMWIAWMFPIYAVGVARIGLSSRILTAFLTSVTMNLSFGPAMMTTHRITDTWIELRAKGQAATSQEIFAANDWPAFFWFVLVKTNLFFWIPMHTITFLLPPVWRLLMAAGLSMALGVLLAIAKRK
jgi:hypothetical protein